MVYQRALKSGGDSRFDEVKHKPATFFAFWMAQGKQYIPVIARTLTLHSYMGICCWPTCLPLQHAAASTPSCTRSA